MHHTFRNTCIKPLGVCATYLMECVYQNFRNAYMKSLRMRASYLWECVQHTFRNACIIPLGVCASYLKYVFSFWVRVCIFFFWVCTRDAWGGAFRPGKHLLLVFSVIKPRASPSLRPVYFEYHYDVFYVRGRGRGERGEGVKCVVCGEVRRKERRSD